MRTLLTIVWPALSGFWFVVGYPFAIANITISLLALLPLGTQIVDMR